MIYREVCAALQASNGKCLYQDRISRPKSSVNTLSACLRLRRMCLCLLQSWLLMIHRNKVNKGKQFLLYAGVYGMFYRVKHSALYLSVCVYFMMWRPNAGKCFHETRNAGTLNKDRKCKDLLTSVSDEPVFV